MDFRFRPETALILLLEPSRYLQSLNYHVTLFSVAEGWGGAGRGGRGGAGSDFEILSGEATALLLALHLRCCWLFGKWKKGLLLSEEEENPTKAEVAKLRLKSWRCGVEGVLSNQKL